MIFCLRFVGLRASNHHREISIGFIWMKAGKTVSSNLYTKQFFSMAILEFLRTIYRKVVSVRERERGLPFVGLWASNHHKRLLQGSSGWRQQKLSTVQIYTVNSFFHGNLGVPNDHFTGKQCLCVSEGEREHFFSLISFCSSHDLSKMSVTGP